MNPLLHKLKTASKFSFTQWKFVVQAYVSLLKIRLFIFFSNSPVVSGASFPLTLPSQQRGQAPKVPVPCSDEGEGVKKISNFTKKELLSFFKIALRYQLIKPSCLVIALARREFLHKHGFEENINLGVRKEKDQLEAHAWCDTPTPHGMELLQPLRPHAPE